MKYHTIKQDIAEHQLNGVCEDEEHQVCFTKKQFEDIWFNPMQKLKEEIKQCEEIIFDMLNQTCGDDDNNKIDNHCMSCYEEATEYLTKKGKLIEINKRMYKIFEKK